MKICLDLDNTILNYEPLFFEASQNLPSEVQNLIQLKSFLQDRSQQEWLEVQGKCYGELVNKVETFPHVTEFIKKSLSEGNEIFLVSHKTKQSYCGNYNNLQEKSLKRLEELGLCKLIGKDNIFFEPSIPSKLSRINSLSPTVVIDDLEKLIVDKEMNNIPFKILFSNTSLEHGLFSHDWKQIENLLSELKPNQYNYISSLRTGNNSVSLLKTGNKKLVLKAFSKEERYKREEYHLKLLENSPKLLTSNSEGLFLIMNYIEGDIPKSFGVIEQKALKELWTKTSKFEATHKRVNLDEYIRHIDGRLKNNRPHYQEFQELVKNIRERALVNDYSPCYNCFNIPDMSLDNIIVQDQKAYFIDFESAGMDDPLRSLGNALFHSRNSLTEDEMIELIDFFVESFPKLLCKSFEIVLDSVALDWLLLEKDPSKSLNNAYAYQKRLSGDTISFSLPERVIKHAKRLSQSKEL